MRSRVTTAFDGVAASVVRPPPPPPPPPPMRVSVEIPLFGVVKSDTAAPTNFSKVTPYPTAPAV